MGLTETGLNIILQKEELSVGVKKIVVRHPFIAKKAQPGQFIIVVPLEDSERIPLTLAGADAGAGTISLIFQEVGTTTRKLGALNTGDRISNLAGPLGRPVDIEKCGTVLLVTGGVGAAFVYWMADAFKAKGNIVRAIMGARTADLLILEREMRSLCDEVIVTTDDGSKHDRKAARR